VSAGTVLGQARYSLAATGPGNFGVFSGGDSGSFSTYTDLYTYATDGVAAGHVASVGTDTWAAFTPWGGRG
jgi:hypothetical protein